MIICFDTSSLLKLYVDEPHSHDVRRWVDAADAVTTSKITLPEAASAIARRRRERSLSAAQADRLLAHLADHWDDYAAVIVNERLAAELAVRHSLRGMDAVQLAAALTVREAASGESPTFFTSFDAALQRAARREGLTMLEPPPDG